jgi:hypothetical protein
MNSRIELLSTVLRILVEGSIWRTSRTSRTIASLVIKLTVIGDVISPVNVATVTRVISTCRRKLSQSRVTVMKIRGMIKSSLICCNMRWKRSRI